MFSENILIVVSSTTFVGSKNHSSLLVKYLSLQNVQLAILICLCAMVSQFCPCPSYKVHILHICLKCLEQSLKNHVKSNLIGSAAVSYLRLNEPLQFENVVQYPSNHTQPQPFTTEQSLCNVMDTWESGSSKNLVLVSVLLLHQHQTPPGPGTLLPLLKTIETQNFVYSTNKNKLGLRREIETVKD